jgi:ribosomal protein S18 acetylase RimI-like enzyme
MLKRIPMTVDVAAIKPADWPAVRSFLETAAWRYEHFELAGQEAYTWPGYVAHDAGGGLLGVMGCWVDRPPVASILYAAIDQDAAPLKTIGALLAPNEIALRRASAGALTFVGHATWLGRHLKTLGFVLETTVISYWRELGDVVVAGNQSVSVRPGQEDDAEAVAAVDESAFEPIWRYPTVKHRSMIQHSVCLLVAEAAGSIVGYLETDLVEAQGVIVRLAVNPAHQRLGIGTRLLTEGLLYLQSRGSDYATLNTQTDNQASRRLYARLRFERFGEEVPVLVKPLS